MEGFDREMRGIVRIFGFIFATGALVFVVAAVLFAGVFWNTSRPAGLHAAYELRAAGHDGRSRR